MHDRALQHHSAGADIVEAPIVIEREHARRDQHELETARWKMKVKIGGACIREINRKIGRDLMEEEGFVVRMKAFVRAAVERLRAISWLVCRFLVAIDGHKTLSVQADGIAVRAREARRF